MHIRMENTVFIHNGKLINTDVNDTEIVSQVLQIKGRKLIFYHIEMLFLGLGCRYI